MSDVACDIPPVPDHLCRFFRIIEITFHNDRPFDNKQTVTVLAPEFKCFRVNDLDTDAGQSRTYASFFGDFGPQIRYGRSNIDGNDR